MTKRDRRRVQIKRIRFQIKQFYFKSKSLFL